MARRQDPLHEQLLRDLELLKLEGIAEIYKEVIDEATSKGWSFLQVLSHLIGHEASLRAERSLQRRIKRARLPKRKTLEEYDFTFPRKIPKQKILRVFDCDFVEQHANVVFIGNQERARHTFSPLSDTSPARRDSRSVTSGPST